MGFFCCISSCTKKSRGGQAVTFHTVPRDPDLKAKWVEFIRIHNSKPNWVPYRTATVCSLHFHASQFLPDGSLKWKSVPTVHNPCTPPSQDTTLPIVVPTSVLQAGSTHPNSDFIPPINLRQTSNCYVVRKSSQPVVTLPCHKVSGSSVPQATLKAKDNFKENIIFAAEIDLSSEPSPPLLPLQSPNVSGIKGIFCPNSVSTPSEVTSKNVAAECEQAFEKDGSPLGVHSLLSGESTVTPVPNDMNTCSSGAIQSGNSASFSNTSGPDMSHALLGRNGSPPAKRRLICESSPQGIETSGILCAEPLGSDMEGIMPGTSSASVAESTTFTPPNKRLLVSAYGSSPKDAEYFMNKKFKSKPNEIEPEDMSSPTSKARYIQIFKTALDDKTRRLANAQQTVRRQKSKISNLKGLLQELSQKRYISDELEQLLQDRFPGSAAENLMRLLQQVKSTRKFPPEIRKFACTLNFLSPAAYNYVREKMFPGLPHEKTISRWYAGVDGKPGFSQEAHDSLKMLAASSKEKQIICGLVSDEMHIRKGLQKVSGDVWGFSYSINKAITDSTPLATQAWMFMLVCLNGSWKLPVGYFLINALGAEERSNIITQCLSFFHDTGITISSFTFDGTTTNLSTARKLGAELSPYCMTPFFRHPVTQKNIYCFLDPVHMLKLWRNVLHTAPLVNAQGQEINFDYFHKLVAYQEKEGLVAANKLSWRHVMFSNEIMKASLAAQTLSGSVAQALTYLCKKMKINEFEGAEPLIEYIETIDKLFDIFNSRNLRAPGDKAPFSCRTVKRYFSFFEIAKQYIQGLKIKETGQVLLKTRYKTGYLGFLVCMESMRGLYKDLVEGHYLSFLLTYKLSQDHIETTFSSLRARGGFNNNPTAYQFSCAYKRILTLVELGGRKGANCWPMDCTTILHVSSSRPKVSALLEEVEKSEFERQEEDILRTAAIVHDHNYISFASSSELSEYILDVVEYIAGFTSVKTAASLSCADCTGALFGSSSNSKLLIQKQKGGLGIASQDVIDICLLTEKELRHAKSCETLFSTNIWRHIINIKQKLPLQIFDSLKTHILEQGPIDNHLHQLITKIVRKYVECRFSLEIKKFNEKVTAERVRKRNTKHTLFKGQ